MTKKAMTNRLNKVARAMTPQGAERPISMVFICEEMDYAEVDGVKMTIAEYEATRDPTDLIVEWPTNEDNQV